MTRAVVVGSGMAGLTAAAYLARDGSAVDVFEQADHIGGVTATLRRQGFAWDLGRRTYQVDHHSFGGVRPVMGKSGASHRTPIDGLWFLGAQSETAGGGGHVTVG